MDTAQREKKTFPGHNQPSGLQSCSNTRPDPDQRGLQGKTLGIARHQQGLNHSTSSDLQSTTRAKNPKIPYPLRLSSVVCSWSCAVQHVQRGSTSKEEHKTESHHFKPRPNSGPRSGSDLERSGNTHKLLCERRFVTCMPFCLGDSIPCSYPRVAWKSERPHWPLRITYLGNGGVSVSAGSWCGWDEMAVLVKLAGVDRQPHNRGREIAHVCEWDLKNCPDERQW